MSYSLLVVLLLSTFAANMSIVWRKSYLLGPDAYVRHRTFGTVNEDYGTKSAGFLVRELIEAYANCEFPPSSMYAYIDKESHIDYFQSFGVYSGLRQNWRNQIQADYGITANVEYNEDINSRLLREQCSVAPFNVILDFCHSGEEPKSLTSNRNYSTYQIVSGNKLLISIFLSSSSPDDYAGPLPGVYSLDFLNGSYDDKYNKLRDSFPDY